MRITLRQLEVFMAIAKSESTTRAGQILSLSQSAVSASLHELEQQLNVQLFERIGKRLMLNENARLLFPRALAMLEQAQELETLFVGGRSKLKLGASTTIGNYLLPKVVASYNHDFPAINLILNIGNSAEVVMAVANFDVDIGFIEGPCHRPELEVKPWFRDELAIVVGAEHPLAQGYCSSQEIAAADWILREEGSGTREVMDQLLLPHFGHLHLVMEMGNSEAIRQTVLEGKNISCLPLQVIQHHLARRELVRLPHPTLFRQLYLIRHKQKHLSQGLQTFLDICSRQLR